MSLLTGERGSSQSLECFVLIKTRAKCGLKSRCQSDLSTVGVLVNRSLHQDLMHNGCRGTAVPNVCLQAFSLSPLPGSPLDQRPIHRLMGASNACLSRPQAIIVPGVVFVCMLTKWCRFHFSYHPWKALKEGSSESSLALS